MLDSPKKPVTYEIGTAYKYEGKIYLCVSEDSLRWRDKVIRNVEAVRCCASVKAIEASWGCKIEKYFVVKPERFSIAEFR